MNYLATAEAIAKILSLLAIPVVLAVVGWLVQDKLATRTVSKDYVQLAVSILSQPKKSEIDPALSDWAVELLNENSPVKFSKEVATQLRSGAVTLPGEQAENLRALASSYAKSGNYTKALATLQESLAIQEKEFGSNHPAVANSLLNLGTLYQAMGRYQEAEVAYQRALAAQEKIYGPEHPEVSDSLSRIGHVYLDMGRLDEAARLFQRVLSIRERALGPGDAGVARSLSDLAVVYDAQGDLAKAQTLRQRADAIYRSSPRKP
jgi:tetratricopeptide (TPR) repeat protein